MNFYPPALQADIARRLKKYANRSRIWQWNYYLGHPHYRTLLWYRLHEANAGVARRLCGRLYRRSSLQSGLEILTPRLGGGVIMPHWGRIVLNAEEIGEDFYVFHNVTIGHDYRNGRPRIGRNVFISTGAILIGEISIGDNVIIGAGSLVNSDIPANSLAVGNPAKVVRATDPDEIQRMIGY